VIGASWHETAYRLRPLVTAADPVPTTVDLLSLEMSIERFANSEVGILLHGLGEPIPIKFRISGSPYFSLGTQREISIVTRTQTGSFEDYLNSFGLHLYLADFSRLHKNQLFRSNLTLKNLPESALHLHDWASLNVDICCEVGTSANGVSIHTGIETILVSSNAAVVVYDHRSGEIADYVSIRDEGGTIFCDVFHCKGSDGQRPGSRVSDAYEVAGQVVKSVILARSPATLKTELTRRLASGSSLKKGSLGELERLLDEAERGRFEFRVRLVQPGISAGAITDPVSRVLAAAYDYVLAATGLRGQVFFQAEHGALVRVHKGSDIQGVLIGEIGFVQRHGDFQPRSQLDVVRQSGSLIVGASTPQGRVLFVPLPMVRVTARTSLCVEFLSALAVGLLALQRQLSNRVRTGWAFVVHADGLIGREPGDVGGDRHRHFASNRRTNPVATPHEAIEDAVFERDHALLSWGPGGIGRRDTDEGGRLRVSPVVQMA
jgi:hypothetical protein